MSAAVDYPAPATLPPEPPTGAPRVRSVRVFDLPTSARLRDFMPADRVMAWVLTAALTLAAFLLRAFGVASPSYLLFDETYYAKGAYSLLHFGYERHWNDKDMGVTNEAFVAGDFSYLENTPDFVVHPPLGKWLIAAGEWAFGVNSFGWRIMAVLFGALIVGMTVRLARRASRSTLVGVIAGVLLMFDGLSFVMSRLALLDIFQAFFIVAGVAAIVADRDWFRNRLADHLDRAGVPDLGGNFGPMAWWRPWRWVAGVMFGAACGVKWNSIYVLAVFGLLSVLWDVGARRLAGAGFRSWLAVLADGLPALVAVMFSAVVTYTATWAGWFATSGGWDRQWGAQHPDDALTKAFGPDIASWLWFHKEIYEFHTGTFINNATHPYNANPLGWLLMIRPIGIDAINDIKTGVDGCEAVGSSCLKVISGMGTPVLWWAAAVALVVAAVWWLAGRDWRFGVPVLGVAATWLPWVYQGVTTTRPLFFFYAITIIPFTVIGLAMALGLLIGKAQSAGRRRGAILAGVLVALVVLDFGYIYPLLTDMLLPYNDWWSRMWLRSWV